MPYAAALSQHPLATHAVGEVVGQVLDQIGDAPDAAVVFVTGPFAGAMEDIAATIRATLRPGALVGATAASVLAGDREVEGTAAIALFALRLDGSAAAKAPPRAVVLGAAPGHDGWPAVGSDPIGVDGSTLVVLADPFSFPVDEFVADAVARAPGTTIVGGLASAAAGPGGNRLVADGRVVDRGAVALVLGPGVPGRPLVSQGCAPVGEPLVVTKASGNMIEEIAGQPALDRLLAQADAAPPEVRNQMARSLQIGLVLDETKATFEQGDFLIRTVLGADHQRRSIAIGADVEVGTTVQFQVRDAATADDDLRHALADASGRAALVFTCNGRGTNLFARPHHDAALVSRHVEGGPVVGMFCAGEIGPVGGTHHTHGMTASMLLFEDG